MRQYTEVFIGAARHPGPRPPLHAEVHVLGERVVVLLLLSLWLDLFAAVVLTLCLSIRENLCRKQTFKWQRVNTALVRIRRYQSALIDAPYASPISVNRLVAASFSASPLTLSG